MTRLVVTCDKKPYGVIVDRITTAAAVIIVNDQNITVGQQQEIGLDTTGDNKTDVEFTITTIRSVGLINVKLVNLCEADTPWDTNRFIAENRDALLALAFALVFFYWLWSRR
jgi:hypothetical protein